jgi:hypothetical protein
MVAGVVGVVALGLCLIAVTQAKIRSDAEEAVIRDWDSTARQLYSNVTDAPQGEGPPAGALLPVRVDDQAERGRVDFRVFLALPPEWRPTKEAPPTQLVVLRYSNAELRHYGQTAKGGDQIRYRQACRLELYALESKELLATRELLSPDPLPEGYRDEARLFVPPELIVAELRDLGR